MSTVKATRSPSDLKAGDAYSETLTFGPEEMEGFVRLTHDVSPVHVDPAASQRMGFEGVLVHGFLLALPFSRIIGLELPGHGAVIGSLELNFHQPAYRGERLTYEVTVARVVQPLRSLLLDLRVTRANGEVCVKGKANCVFR